MCSFCEHSELQKEVLRRQATIAVEASLPLVIHSRDAEHDIIEELEKVRVGVAGFLLIGPVVFCDSILARRGVGKWLS